MDWFCLLCRKIDCFKRISRSLVNGRFYWTWMQDDNGFVCNDIIFIKRISIKIRKMDCCSVFIDSFDKKYHLFIYCMMWEHFLLPKIPTYESRGTDFHPTFVFLFIPFLLFYLQLHCAKATFFKIWIHLSFLVVESFPSLSVQLYYLSFLNFFQLLLS